MNPRRRSDDTHDEVDAEYVEEWFADLPKMAEQVERNRKAAARGDKVSLFLFVFILVVGLAGGLFLEQKQAVDRRAAYTQCQLVNDNAVALNEFIDRIVVAVRTSETLTPAEKATRVEQYLAIKQSLPVCRK